MNQIGRRTPSAMMAAFEVECQPYIPRLMALATQVHGHTPAAEEAVLRALEIAYSRYSASGGRSLRLSDLAQAILPEVRAQLPALLRQ